MYLDKPRNTDIDYSRKLEIVDDVVLAPSFVAKELWKRSLELAVLLSVAIGDNSYQ
jgi:hypothetical protein